MKNLLRLCIIEIVVTLLTLVIFGVAFHWQGILLNHQGAGKRHRNSTPFIPNRFIISIEKLKI